MRYLAELYQAYKDGHLLERGSWGEQPAWYTDAMSLMSNEMNSAEADRMKRMQNT